MEPAQIARDGERRVSTDFRNKRVTVMGLGRFGGGVGVSRWLAAQGAIVTVTDKEPAEKLEESIAALMQERPREEFPAQQRGRMHTTGAQNALSHAALDPLLAEYWRDRFRFRLGEHVEQDFREADLVVVNPAVPPRSPLLKIAEQAGVPITTEINLFLERCPARCIGVTGTVGKSTTVAMIAHVLSQLIGQDRVWLGGNIGRCLLEELPRIQPDHWVVLELSSFQLFRTPAIRWRPEIAVITNLAPNHLDWHETFEHYAQAKLNLVRYQRPGQGALVIGDEPELKRLVETSGAAARDAYCFGERNGTPYFFKRGVGSDAPTLLRDQKLQVPGRHNRINAAAATAVARIVGIDSSKAQQSLSAFEGLPNRLKRVAQVGGVSYYDDSKSTTPEAALTAMAAFEQQPLVLILGGYDKGADLAELCRAAAQRARFVACVGQTGPRVCEQVEGAGGQARFFENFDDAVRACCDAAKPGDAVLLSPGCASWGMFTDYRERGQRFSGLVQSWRTQTT